MKALRNIGLLTIVLVAGLAITWSRIASAGKDKDEQGRTVVTVRQLPDAVRATLRRESRGGTLGKIEKETRHGRIIYEADITLDSRNYEAKVTEDGILLKKELENMEEHDGYIRHNRWSFERDKVGVVPEGWKAVETRGRGKLATWKVITDKSAPSPTHVVAITRNKNYGGTFNILMAEDSNYKDPDITVMVKAIYGHGDQGGGPVWRAKDANNYYVCRWNPLEDNFRIYYVKNGRRRQIGSATIKTNPTSWHKIRVEQKGTRIMAWFDGKKMIELEDSTFTQPGMVGLWVKADGRSEFDNINVFENNGENRSEDKYKDREENEQEQAVALSSIPAKVLKAVNKAVAGGKVIEAEKEIDDNVATYEVTKIVNNVKYEIKVTSNGSIKEIEKKGHDEDSNANDNDDNDNGDDD